VWEDEHKYRSSFVTRTLHLILLNDGSRMFIGVEEMRNSFKILVGKSEGKDRLEFLSTDEKTILKLS
jgi:hypothetical protein